MYDFDMRGLFVVLIIVGAMLGCGALKACEYAWPRVHVDWGVQ